VNHFTAKCRFDALAAPREVIPEVSAHEKDHVTLDPITDVYDDLLFHTGRFRRINGYRHLTATECVAELSGDAREVWFGEGLSQTLVLGDPAARDATIHAIQACIPHRRVLPLRVERLVINSQPDAANRIVVAKERSRTADEFIYDVVVRDNAGRVLESWEGLCLRAVAPMPRQNPWAEALLSPYLERRLAELMPDAPVFVNVSANGSGSRHARSANALQRAAGAKINVLRRSDGKPELAGEDQRKISTAHAGKLTLAACSESDISCDLARVEARLIGDWTALLTNDQRRLAEAIRFETSEDFSVAATRVWAASECLKKADMPGGPVSPLTLQIHEQDQWLLLGSPIAQVATWVAQPRTEEQPLVFAFLTRTPSQAQSNRAVTNRAPESRFFEYRHIVTFEETNVVGNVYFVNHLSWQGRCREMFLREKAPNAVRDLDASGLSLATSAVSCEYFEELFPFDEVVVRMSLRELTPGSALLDFDYFRKREASLDRIACGQHTVAVKRKAGSTGPHVDAPAVFPPELQAALEEYLPSPPAPTRER
jgi:enediyne polyketide synthase